MALSKGWKVYNTLPSSPQYSPRFNNYINLNFLRIMISWNMKIIEKWTIIFCFIIIIISFFNIWCNQYKFYFFFYPLVGPSIFISIFQTFDVIFSNVKRLRYALSRITSALSVREGTPSREEGHLELLDLRIHSKRYSESYW